MWKFETTRNAVGAFFSSPELSQVLKLYRNMENNDVFYFL